MTEDEGLFGSLPGQREDGRQGGAAGAPRLREARRDQVELGAVDLDSLVAADHPVRAVWAFAGGLDLRPLLAGIKAREGVPGHPPADPRILMALWLYATVDAVGSARALARLSESHVAYRWLCGGVSMNHHTLSDFRVSQEALLDRLLAQGVAGLVSAGLVTLERLAQDGVRIRASAGLGSSRRRDRLEQRLAEATQRVARLRAELEADPAATTARQREERTQAALKRLEEFEARRQRRERTHKKAMQRCKPPAASTTDADASKMKMADGGSRPGHNAQFASDPETRVIVAVALDTTGSDAGQMARMLDQIARTYDGVPGEYLVDAASPSSMTSRRPTRLESRSTPPPRGTSTAPNHMRRVRRIVPGPPTGAGGWPATRARRPTAAAPRPNASTPICAIVSESTTASRGMGEMKE